MSISACGPEAPDARTPPRVTLHVSVENQDILTTFQSLPGISIENVRIGSSQKRLEALQSGAIDLAVTGADVTYLAFAGRLPDELPAMSEIRGMALLYRLVVHMLVGPHVDVSHGLKGMRIALGNPIGPNEGLGQLLVSSMGLQMSDIRGQVMPYDDAVDKILKGDIDIAIITSRLPQERVARALRGGARIVEINGPEIDRLRAHYPLLRRALLPKFTYPSQDVPLHTIGVDVMLSCRAGLNPEVVHQLTRALFEDSPKGFTDRADPQRAPATIVPLHAGAARYYREREIEQ